MKATLRKERLLCVVAAVMFIFLGYAIARISDKYFIEGRTSDQSFGRVLFFQQMLSSMEHGDTDTVRAALVHESESALRTIVESGDSISEGGSNSTKIDILRKYKAFRDARPELFKVPSELKGESANEWAERAKLNSSFLESLEKKSK